MILDTHVEVGINYKNIEHFKMLGYNVKCSERIVVPIGHLSEQSNILIKVRCDICGNEKNIKYQNYVKGTKFGTTYYACSSKCAWDKNRETNLQLYGVEAPMQNKEVRDKSETTCIEKYGVENISQSEYFKEKYTNIMLERYGVENGFQYEAFKKKSMETMQSKYGVYFNFQRKEMKETMMGEKNRFYIHGEYNPTEWHNPEANTLRTNVFIRDNRTCDICGIYNIDIQVHHLYSRNTHKHLILVMENCKTVCKCCHKEFHDKYGYGNNTPEQYNEFKSIKMELLTTIENN